MKRKNSLNINGITVSDSIVMSVKRKNVSHRKLFSGGIAIIGFISVIMAFLRMFSFNYSTGKVIIAAAVCSGFYLLLSVIGGKALWLYAASGVAFAAAAFRESNKIALGFKYLYNIIYKVSNDSEINYYKGLSPELEIKSVTLLFVFYIWLLAIVLFFFTICRPNPVLPLMITFPVLEIGMYNGIELPVFWGMLCIAYWLALLAMSTIDIGEYSGGNSGFVRKDNLFFPKRQMKLKVTEKCGMFIIAAVMIITSLSYGTLKAFDYKRSDKINQKRRDITDAINNFSIENIAESLANLSMAIGLEFDYESHKLGNFDHISYKNVTELTVTLDKISNGAIYLKDYTGAVYKDNEWFDLPSSKYDNALFDDFKKYNLYPQDFPAFFTNLLEPNVSAGTIWIKNSPKKIRRTYAPYNTLNYGDIAYDKDLTISSTSARKGESSYKFIQSDSEELIRSLIAAQKNENTLGSVREVYSVSEITDEHWRDAIMTYCTENELLTDEDSFMIDTVIPADRELLLNNGTGMMYELLQNSYRDFVYDNYLSIPKTKEMDEVRAHYEDIVSRTYDNETSLEKLTVLNEIRERMASECTYSLYPRKTPSNRDFVNYFLLENQKGYCTHYATAGVMLARMAGIPARYSTGYVIVESDINAGKIDNGSVTVDVMDNRSHAWAEVYIDGIGWLPFEFTAGYSAQEIDTEPKTEEPETTEEKPVTTTVTTGSATTRQSKATTGHSTATSSAVETTDTVTSAGNGHFGGKSEGKPIPKAVRNTILIAVLIAILIGAVILRRNIILRLRQKHFSSGNTASRVRYMYAYSEKLFEILKMSSENGGYRSFAKEIEEHFGGEYFTAGDFIRFTDIALKASFGKSAPNDEEFSLCRHTIEEIADNIYSKSSALQKIKLRFIDVIR